MAAGFWECFPTLFSIPKINYPNKNRIVLYKYHFNKIELISILVHEIERDLFMRFEMSNILTNSMVDKID